MNTAQGYVIFFFFWGGGGFKLVTNLKETKDAKCNSGAGEFCFTHGLRQLTRDT